jgi:hypothetical protein
MKHNYTLISNKQQQILNASLQENILVFNLSKEDNNGVWG